MIQRPENRETSRPGTMYFVPITPLAQWRFDRDVSPVHYHAPARRPSRLRVAPSWYPRDGHSYHSRVDRALRDRADLAGRTPNANTPGALSPRPLPRRLEPASEADAPLHQGTDGRVDRLGEKRPQAGLPVPGRLCVLEKAFAKKLPWAGWTYSFAKGRKVYGLHVVVLLWTSDDRQWRIPVAFRIWRPKRSCSARRYKTKLQLAEGMLKNEILASGLPFRYLVFDTHYSAGWFTRRLTRMGIEWVGTLHPRTVVFWGGERQHVRQLAGKLRLKWRAQLGLRATAVRVYAPKYGELRLVVTRNRHSNYDYIVSGDQETDLTTVVERKRSRWQIETLFRDTKQLAGLEACQCWVDQAMVRHVGLVLLAFVVLQMMRRSPIESVGSVKERWQLAVTQDGQPPPLPLKACPSHLRATA
jgi:hypothetical protein